MSVAVIAVVVVILLAVAAAAAFLLLRNTPATPAAQTTSPASGGNTKVPTPAPAPSGSTDAAGYDASALPGFARLEGYSLMNGDITELKSNPAQNIFGNDGQSIKNHAALYRNNVTIAKCAEITKAQGDAAIGFVYDKENSRCQPVMPPVSKPPPQVTKTLTYIKNGDKNFVELADQRSLSPYNYFDASFANQNNFSRGVTRGMTMIDRNTNVTTADGCKSICAAQNADGLTEACHAAQFIEYSDTNTGVKKYYCGLMKAVKKPAYDTYIRA